MGFYVETYDEVYVDIDTIIKKLKDSDLKELAKRIIRKFPNLLKDEKLELGVKLYPKPFKDQLKQKYKQENHSLLNF